LTINLATSSKHSIN